MKRMILMEMVPDTYTNTAGAALAIQLRKDLKQGYAVEISFLGASPLSSSFFNSSFGTLIEDFGYDEIKSKLKIVDVNSSHANLLRRYFDAYNENHHC